MALTTAQIQNAYVAFFNRPADVAGLTYWSTYAGSTADLLNTFAQSTEYKNLYSGLNNTQIVNAVYSNLFGHTPDVAGLTYWVTQLDQGKLAIGNIADAINKGAQGTDATIISNKVTAATAFTTALDTTAEIVAYAGISSTGLDAVKAWLAAVTSDSATLTNATSTATLTSITNTVLNNVGGTTFTLTTAIDNVTGTSGNDTIVGDFTATATLNAGDQINGGNGTDTLKMYGTYAAANLPLSISNVEVLDLVTAADAALDLSALTKATTGISKVVIENAAAINGKTITTTAGQALSLATGATGTHTAGTVTWVASTTDTTLDLTLNGYQGGTGATPVALTITAPAATTQNIASTTAANKVTTLTLGAQTNKVVVTGDKALTVSTDLVSSGGATVLKTVDASATTGGVNITLAAATNAAFAFTGGSGNDSVKFADNGLGALTAGSQLDGGAGTADKIGLLDTALSAAEYTALNAAKNFEVIGLNAALTVDASQLAGYKAYSLDANAAQVINNTATGTSVSVTAAHAAAITVGSAVGVTDLTFNIGTSTTTGLALGGNTTLSGQTAIALTSNGTNASANTVNNLVLTDNAVVTITGSNDLTITGIANATTTGHKIDGSAATGKLNITANQVAYAAGSSLGDVLIGGTAADTLKAGLNSTKLTGNAGADSFDVSTAVTGATTVANITTITDFTKGDKIVFASASAFTATKVDLTGVTTEQAAIDALVAGNNSDLKWGVYNGNTYLVDDVGTGATMAATDVVVKLTGVLDLSASTVASNTLTFA